MHFSIYICIENLYKMIPIYGEMVPPPPPNVLDVCHKLVLK